MNRSRLRRVLCREIVEWDSLQADVSPDGKSALEFC